MSTKTTLKRIALVAVSALGFGLVSAIAPANAAVGWTCTGAYSTATCTQVVGGIATIQFEAGTTDTVTVTTDIGSMVNPVVTAGNAYVQGTTSAVSASTAYTAFDFKPSAAGDKVTVTVRGTGAVATQTVTATRLNSSGTPVVSYTRTISWVAVTATAVSAANSYLSIQDAACQSAGASIGADKATSADYEDGAGPASSTQYICLYVRDANGAKVSGATAYLAADKGTLSASSVTVTSGVNASSVTYTGNAGVLGTATVTANIVDAQSNVISLTAKFGWIGASPATIALANLGYASAAGGTTTNTGANAPLSTDYNRARALALTYKDSLGQVISAYGDSNIAFTVDSNYVDGAPAARASDAMDSAGPALATTAARYLTYGYDFVSVACGTAGYPQALAITAWTKNAAGSWISSNTVNYYCSSATASTISVTTGASSVESGGSTTVNFSIKDAYGMPVPDGSSFAISANNGSTVSTSLTSTTNGALSTAATLVASSTANDTTVVVSRGSKVGSAKVAITGSSANTSVTAANAAADAALEAIDAANAATDAANLAAEAADAATMAAQDAKDAADAATAAVEKLAQDVATMIDALKAQLATLANVVAKIAKKVKA